MVLIGAWFGEKFADNSRYLYQYLHDNKDKLGLNHVIWVTLNKKVYQQLSEMGYEVYLMDSDESIEWHKRAKYHIICNTPYALNVCDKNGVDHIINGDIMGELSYRSKRINLWHGTGGLKAVHMSSNTYKNKKRKHPICYSVIEWLSRNSLIYQKLFREKGGWGDCYQIATSPLQVSTLRLSYGRKSSKCIVTCYPRNCMCIRLLKEEENIIDELKKYEAIILYLPTFRTNSSFEYSNLSSEMYELLKQKKILWIEKAHSAEKVNTTSFVHRPNVIKLNPDFDINVLLPYITLLITDYSSVRMDAMFHNKATLFYVPDFEEYMCGDNGFLADPNEVMCGPKLKTVQELYEAIDKYIFNPDASKTPNYQEIRDRYWSSNKSLAEIWMDIKKQVD